MQEQGQVKRGFNAAARGWLSHILAILSLLIAVIIMSYTVFYNAPLPFSVALPADKADARVWLFTLDMTDGMSKATQAMMGNGQTKRMGFGIWGHCQWLAAQSEGDATCYNALGWKVTYTGDNDDAAQMAGLPEAISQVLSGAGLCLTLVWAIVLGHFISLLFAAYYPHANLIKKRGDNSATGETGNWRVGAAIFVGNTWHQIIAYALIFLLILPTLICVGAGMAAYDGKAEWKAGLGLGSSFLIATLVLSLAAMWLILGPTHTGLWNNSHAQPYQPRDKDTISNRAADKAARRARNTS